MGESCGSEAEIPSNTPKDTKVVCAEGSCCGLAVESCDGDVCKTVTVCN